MKKIERGSVKYLALLVLLTAIWGMILYPLLDLLYCKVITHSTFEYSYFNHIVQPIMFACIYGVTFWLFDRKK